MFILRSNHDLQTSYLYEYTKEIIKFAEDKGLKTTILENEKLNDEVYNRLIKNKPKLVFFNGHGDNSSWYNTNNKAFLNLKSADALKGTITFSRACDCLKKLGPKAVKENCLAFIGYKNKFLIAREHGQTCRPLKDPVAKPILQCSNIIMKELIKGKNVKDALNSSNQLANKKILELIYSKEPWASASLQAVLYNDSSLGFVGSEESSI